MTDIAGLVLTGLALLGGFCAWIITKILAIGRMNAQIEYILKRVDEQVSNTHETNLRDDITEIKSMVNALAYDNMTLHNRLNKHLGVENE